ncbi:hypothetical protein LX36DRAFT_675912 [Colletotrichum falcatum]|nr:hypothetical protein LX36DRAFT_675912 [Colletotrichum falcatum]
MPGIKRTRIVFALVVACVLVVLFRGNEAPFQSLQSTNGITHTSSQRPALEIEPRRQEWHEFVKGRMMPCAHAKDPFSGRGLVIVAGNAETVMRVKVVLRQLKRLGSTIAVEVHYWDTGMDIGATAELNALYEPIHHNDLSKDDNVVRIKKDGIIRNIMRYFGPTSHARVRRTRPGRSSIPPCRMAEREQESGQPVVDEKRFWHHLQLASWLNNEQGRYYNGFLLGEQGHVPASRGTPCGCGRRSESPPDGWRAVGAENDGFYCGHSFAQHRPDGRPRCVPPRRAGQDGRPSDESPHVNVNVAIKWDGAAYLPEHSDEFVAAQCTEMVEIQARDVNEILPGFEGTFRELGGGGWCTGSWTRKDTLKPAQFGSLAAR